MPMRQTESTEHSRQELPPSDACETALAPPHRPNRAERRLAARNEARKVPYLSERAGQYYFVRRYPEHLIREGYVTAPACRVSLRTSDRLRAERLARRYAYRFDRLVEAFSQEIVQDLDGARPAGATEVLADDVPVLARRFEALLLHSDDVDRSERLSPQEMAVYVDDIDEQRTQLRLANACGDYDAVADDTRGFLEVEKLQCPEGSDVWRSLLKEVMLAQLRALRGIVDRLEGETSAPATPAEAPAPLRSDNDLDDLDRAFAHWTEKARPKSKTIAEAQVILERLKAVTGKTRISTLTRSDMVNFQSSESRRIGARGKPVRPQTVNKMLGLLRAILGLAVDDLLRERGVLNPLEKLRKEKVKSSDITEKLDLSSEQLDALFGGPVHARGERPVGGAGEASFWMILLGHTTGSRMGELAQLSVHEVVTRDGVACLWLTTRNVKEQVELHKLSDEARDQLVETSLKTGASRRVIPLHPRILELGFLDYVEFMRKAGSFALFPDIKPDHQGVVAGNFSKWFNGYLRKIGIKRRGLDWVSFRHTLKTWMREAEVPQDVQDYLQGHTAERVAQSYGRFTPKKLLAELTKLSFPSLQLVPKWTPAMMRGRA